jgi:methionyl aminopeptidase
MIPEQYFKAGKVAAKVRENFAKKRLIGMKLYNICEDVERMIVSLGAKPAFPCNICLNDAAAHYTPLPSDDRRVEDGDVVKLDIGVHIDGYIADTALTLCYNPKYYDMVNTTKLALKEALRAISVGVSVSNVGKVIQGVAESRGYKPIANLSGHSLDQYVIHSGKSIPNVWILTIQKIKQDEVYAVEPFLTTRDGAGRVIEREKSNIYALVTRKRKLSKKLDELIDIIWQRYKTLPFTTRWLIKDFGEKVIEYVEELVRKKVLRSYPILKEAKGKVVAQAEHTIAVTNSGSIITTEGP